jgi:N-acetylmuramoyl-L-alanine amidase
MHRPQDHGRQVLRTGLAWLAVLFALLLGQATAIAAPDSEPPALRAHAYRMAGDAVRMRIVVEFNREPDVKWFLLRGPHRLVVDLPETTFAFEPDSLDPRGLVTGVRYGNLGTGSSRIILSGKGPFTVENLSLLENENSPGHRMVIDIIAGSEAAFERALADQATTTASTVTTGKSDRVGVRPRTEKPFTIVIDPGHGGIDGGAKALGGTAEKDLTLSFSRELRERLKAIGRFNVFMTRDDDVFLRLDERVRIARQHDADLFVSIHADTISQSGVRGASVYTISEKASDEVARAAAERENLADSVAGIEIADENQEVADILYDLVRRETHGFSVTFARSLVDELGRKIELINNPRRSAGFRVLRAPDVPSVLVELGYLSNAKDLAKLQDPVWRDKAVSSMIEAIDAFAAIRTGAGG